MNQSSAIQIYLFITENMILKTKFSLKYLYHKKLEASAMIRKHKKGCRLATRGRRLNVAKTLSTAPPPHWLHEDAFATPTRIRREKNTECK